MRKAICISLTLFACSVQADDLCTLKSANIEKTVKIDGVPGFFFKVHPDGQFISYISAKHNSLLNVETGAEFPILGKVDPIWSPDGKFYAHPGEYIEERDIRGPMRVYDGKTILEATQNHTVGKVAPVITELEGVYQSIGLLDGKYKVLSDKNGLSMTEFVDSGSGPKFVSDIKRPCSNIKNLPTELPMLSRDGRFLSVLDSKNFKTKIYKFNGENCDLALEIEPGTGKVSFNNDSSQVVFHVDQFEEKLENGYFSGVAKDKLKNVVVMNLDETKEGKLIPSSWALASLHTRAGDGGYYPDYDKHNNIYYMEDIDNNFQFVKVSQKNLEFRPFEKDMFFRKKNCVNCEAEKKTDSGTHALAKMWTKLCADKNSLPMYLNREMVMAIDPVQCAQMVNQFWVASLSVSKDELLKVCPKKLPQTPVHVGSWNNNQKLDAEDLLKARCLTCHSEKREYEKEENLQVWTGPASSELKKITVKHELPAFDFDKLDYHLITKMIDAVKSQQMPKLDPLSEKNQNLVISYLQKKKLTMDWSKKDKDYLSVFAFTEENLEIERQRLLSKLKNPTPFEKEKAIIEANCEYGQLDCDKYLKNEMPEILAKAALLPANGRQKFIDDEIMTIKCENLFDVTTQQCLDWDRMKKKQLK